METDIGVISKISDDGAYGFIRTVQGEYFFTRKRMVPVRTQPITPAERIQLFGAKVRFLPKAARKPGYGPEAFNVEVVDED